MKKRVEKNGNVQRKRGKLIARMIISILAVFLLGCPSLYAVQTQHRLKPLKTTYSQLVPDKNMTSSKQREITLNADNAPLLSVLKQLANKARVGISYQDDMIPDKKVTVHVKDVSVYQALHDILKGTRLKAVLPFSRDVLVIKKRELKADVQQETVTGTVTDANTGNPLVGVNILVIGTTTGAVTDENGNYSLIVPSLQDTLRFSYIGYQTKTVPINGQSTINIALQPKVISGQEMVVVGYGEQTRQSLTGAISIINFNEIKNQPVANITNALQGLAPNLTIQQPNGGAPGANVNLNIRGITTMNNNSPLIVVDGVAGVSLNNLNPNNIKSMSILKDAASAAIYGSRAANGVILVTTKNGKENAEPTVTFSAQTGINVPNIPYEPVKGYINAILRNQAEVNSGGSPIYSPKQIRELKRHDDIDWYLHTILKNALQQDYNLAVSGGSENTTYRASVRYYNQKNNFIGGYGLKSYNARLNLHTEYEGFTVKANLDFQRSYNKTPAAGSLIADAKRTPTYYYYKMKANGRYLINDVLSQFSPLGELQKGGWSKATNNVFSGILQVKYKVAKGLEARANFSTVIHANTNLLVEKEVKYYSSPTASKYASTSGSNRSTNNDNYNSIRINPKFILHYKGGVGEHHNFSALIGVSENSLTNSSNGIHERYTDPDLHIPTSETEIQSSSYTMLETKSQSRLYSAFGRARYNYNQKYFFEFDFRYDGSSKFAEGNRWSFFPAVSAAWNISDESFLKAYKERVGTLKLRASYGRLGNQSVGNYQYQTTYFTFSNAYAFNNSPVSGTGFTFANRNIHWETTSTADIGLDASFFKNKLRASVDIYQKNTTDILITPTVPGTYGGAVPNYNAGSMRNRGWGVSLNYNISGSKFSHSISFNVSDTWNTVTNFTGMQITSYDGMERIVAEGVPFNSYYGYKVAGFFQNEQQIKNAPKPIGVTVKPGDVRYVDKNGDGVIDDQDRFVFGNAFPRYTFGLQYGLKWRNFNLNLLIQGVGKRTMDIRGGSVEPFHENYVYTMYRYQTDYWTPTNPDARWPRLSAPGSASNTNNWHMNSNLHYFNASYIRLRNVRIGYTLPEKWSLGAKQIYIYLNAQNLFYLSNISFLNPQSTGFNSNMNNATGDSGRGYPATIYYGFGIKVSL